MKFTLKRSSDGPQRVTKKPTSMYVAPDPNAQNHKRKLIFGGAIIFFVLLNVGLFFLTTQFPTPEGSGTIPTPVPNDSKTDKLLAIVGEEKIFRNYVKIVASQYYKSDSITDETLKKTFNTVIERAILDTEAKKMKISVTEDEITTEAKKRNNSTKIPLSPRTHDDIKYQLLEEKVSNSNVKKAQTYFVSFWVSPRGTPEEEKDKATIEKQRKDGYTALTEAEQRFKRGEEAMTIGKALVTKYPTLQKVLSINGYSYALTKDETLFTKPKQMVISKEDIGEDTYNVLINMKANDIKQVKYYKDSGGATIKVISTTFGTYNSYAEFLDAKKKEYVKIYDQP